MSQLATASSRFPQLRADNITLGSGSGGLGVLLMIVGAAAGAACGFIGYQGIGSVGMKHALAAYHIGTMSVLAICLGALFFCLIFHLLQAGWVATVRRQFENVAGFLPFAFLLVLPTIIIEIATGGHLFQWLGDAKGTDYLLNKKAIYFFGLTEVGKGEIPFPSFFVLRIVIYGFIWTYLSRRMISLGRQQDTASDAKPFAQARFTAAWGILLFALTTAFAAFDWLMSLDYKFFSTMWGVYYFASAAFSSVPVVVLVLAVLRSKGKLQGAVTQEHFHDLGKLMLTFTIFWAYIAFCQYMLIWYSNIPEETAYMLHRTAHWKNLGILLMVGHFVAPFLILLFRGVKQNYRLLSLVALWAIFIHMMDMYWVIRPMVYTNPANEPGGSMPLIVEICGMASALLILVGYLMKRVPSAPLVGVGDPFMKEAISHKNYV